MVNRLLDEVGYCGLICEGCGNTKKGCHGCRRGVVLTTATNAIAVYKRKSSVVGNVRVRHVTRGSLTLMTKCGVDFAGGSYRALNSEELRSLQGLFSQDWERQ